jgi:hypothetical protein
MVQCNYNNWICGAMVARLTPDQKVACSIHVRFTFSLKIGKNAKSVYKHFDSCFFFFFFKKVLFFFSFIFFLSLNFFFF